MKQTTWRPDTCGCEIVFEWDETIPASERQHEFKKFNKKCQHHNAEPDMAKIHDENKTKNAAVSEVEKLTKKYSWSFDAGRNLIITLDVSEKAKKAQLENALKNPRIKVE